MFPPDDSTTDPEDFDYDSWAADDIEGQLFWLSAGLQRAVPIMITTPEGGYHKTMFRAGGKFYFRIVAEGGFLEVNVSQDLKTVIEPLVTNGDREIKLSEIRKWWMCICRLLK